VGVLRHDLHEEQLVLLNVDGLRLPHEMSRRAGAHKQGVRQCEGDAVAACLLELELELCAREVLPDAASVQGEACASVVYFAIRIRRQSICAVQRYRAVAPWAAQHD